MTYYVINQTNSINNTTDNLPSAALVLGASDKLLVQYDGSLLATGLNSSSARRATASTRSGSSPA
jgi:hypothetical protein